jgi:predicted peptidase
MLTKIKFSDGTELTAAATNATQVYAQGTNRAAIEIQIAKDATTFEELDRLTADTANTGKLTIVEGDVQYVRDNYSIRSELAVKPVVIAPATSTEPEQTEERFVVVLAQLTYSEVQLAAQAAMIAKQSNAIAELSILVAGGTN